MQRSYRNLAFFMDNMFIRLVYSTGLESMSTEYIIQLCYNHSILRGVKAMMNTIVFGLSHSQNIFIVDRKTNIIFLISYVVIPQ